MTDRSVSDPAAPRKAEPVIQCSFCQRGDYCPDAHGTPAGERGWCNKGHWGWIDGLGICAMVCGAQERDTQPPRSDSVRGKAGCTHPNSLCAECLEALLLPAEQEIAQLRAALAASEAEHLRVLDDLFYKATVVMAEHDKAIAAAEARGRAARGEARREARRKARRKRQTGSPRGGTPR